MAKLAGACGNFVDEIVGERRGRVGKEREVTRPDTKTQEEKKDTRTSFDIRQQISTSCCEGKGTMTERFITRGKEILPFLRGEAKPLQKDWNAQYGNALLRRPGVT